MKTNIPVATAVAVNEINPSFPTAEVVRENLQNQSTAAFNLPIPSAPPRHVDNREQALQYLRENEW